MTVFFNLKHLEEQAGEDNNKFIALLKYHYFKNLPANRYSKYKPSKISLAGNSYLLNPEPLFKSTVDIHYIIQYIKLAARRDYTLYKQYNRKTLLISYFPDIDIDTIKHNPLLNITKSEIFFKFEEN